MADYYTAPTAGDYGVRDCSNELLRSLRAPRADARSVLEREQIVFVCHSAGGIVVRYLLAEHYKEFQDKSVFLLLLASPSVGSRYATLLWMVTGLFGHTLGKELKLASPLLTDLDGRFKTFVNEKRIAKLSGVELFEHPPFWRPTIVQRRSAGRYFGDPVAAPGETHKSISKPQTRHHVAHRCLVDGVSRLEPIPSAPEPPVSIAELIARLTNQYAYVWERGNLPDPSGATVYWPVTLRHPVLIHAAQAFTAASLQRLGAKVCLAIDDLGNPQYDFDRCKDQLIAWYVRAGGAPERIAVMSFKNMDRSGGNSSELRWSASERWLGSSNWTLEKVLPICKLTGVDPSSTDLQALLRQKPRRLLTPPVVWAALTAMVRQDAPTSVITLSGYDERPLWDAWRHFEPSEGRVATGHLYLPDLRPRVQRGDATPLHMEVTKLIWQSRQDILRDLGRVHGSSAHELLEPNSLHWWALQLCVLMPTALARLGARVVISGERVTSVFDAKDSPRSVLDNALAKGLEEAML